MPWRTAQSGINRSPQIQVLVAVLLLTITAGVCSHMVPDLVTFLVLAARLNTVGARIIAPMRIGPAARQLRARNQVVIGLRPEVNRVARFIRAEGREEDGRRW